MAGSATGTNYVSLANIEYDELLIYVHNTKLANDTTGWFDSSLIVPKITLDNREVINMPSYIASDADFHYCVCKYDKLAKTINIHRHRNGTENVYDYSTLYVYYR